MTKQERQKLELAKSAMLMSKNQFFLIAEKMGLKHPDALLARKCFQVDREEFRRLKRKYYA